VEGVKKLTVNMNYKCPLAHHYPMCNIAATYLIILILMIFVCLSTEDEFTVNLKIGAFTKNIGNEKFLHYIHVKYKSNAYKD